MDGWNWVDLVIVVVALIGAYGGLRRGFIREGMSVAGLLAGVWAAGRWQDDVAKILRPFMGGGELVSMLAFLLVILAAMIAATLLTVLLERFRRIPMLGGLDRVGGVALGAVLGVALALLALTVAARYTSFGIDGAIESARIPRAVLEPLPRALSQLPPELSSVGELFGSPSHPD